MADGVLFNIATEIIKKLGSSVWEEMKLWWSVKDELEELKMTVSTIQAVLLHAEEKSMESLQVKNWVGLLSDAMYDTDDLLDEFSTQALRQQLMSGSKFSKEVRLFFSSSNQFAYGLKMAHQIKAMKDRLEKIKANKGFLLEERHAEARLERDQTHSNPPTVVIGRENDKQALIESLLSSDFDDENVSIISIVGIGGLGKTTLAQLVYNDEKVEGHFELKMWACVSDNFYVKLIVEKILESATKMKPNVSGMDALKNILHEKINGKRYLIVLDDVWEDNSNEWSPLKNLLDSGARGSKIIITTRLPSVADMTRSIYVRDLKGFPEEESWSLFKQYAFKRGQVPTPSHEAVGKEIIAKCKGVPLAINTMARLLFFMDSESQWLDFKNKELSKVEQQQGDILPTLKLSYDHLPSHLKHCFAYCSLFPKDKDIKVGKLIRLWMAQGYVTSSDPEQNLEDIGAGYFAHLYRRCFFQEVEKDEWGNIRSCKMHDLMHDLAMLVAGDKGASVSSSAMASVRHVSLGRNPYIPSLLKATKVRTLIPKDQGIYFTEEDLHEVFCKLRCLRALDLSDNGIKTLPNSIYKLKHLRYLDLSWNVNIEKLPDSITKLHNLQVLNLEGLCLMLTQLPKDIAKLVNLRHLDNAICIRLTHMPRGIGKLTQLETLSFFVIAKDESVSEHSGGIDELGGLNKLRSSLYITNLRNVKNGASECKAANLKEKQHLRELTLEYGYNEDGYDSTNEEMGLEELRPHQNLKSLWLYWYIGAKCPSWLPSLTNLESIYLYGCKRMRRLLPLDHLSCLQKITIQGLTNLEWIELSDGGSASFFPSLKEFYLHDCPKLEGFVLSPKAELPYFPCLSKLFISNCPKLTWMPLSPSLRELILEGDGLLNNIMKTSVSQSTSSSSPFSALSQLKQLQIQNVVDLEDLPEGLQYVTTLQRLDLNSCPNLKCIPEWLPNLTSLQYLDISECPQLSERCNNNMAQDWPYIATIPNIKIDWREIQGNGRYLNNLYPIYQLQCD